MYADACLYVYVRVCVYLCVYVYVYVYVYVDMYVCMCTYAFINLCKHLHLSHVLAHKNA